MEQNQNCRKCDTYKTLLQRVVTAWRATPYSSTVIDRIVIAICQELNIPFKLDK